MREPAIVALLVICASCGPDGRTEDPQPGLRIEPADVTLLIEAGAAPVQQTYKVIFEDADGAVKDVTAETMLTLGTPDLGTLVGAEFTSAGKGGKTLITATWQGELAVSNLTLKLKQVVIDPGAPPDSPDQFDNGQPGGAPPDLVYPASGIIVPPNMRTLEFHYIPAGQTLFELVFEGETLHLEVYFVCTPLSNGCSWTPSPQTWDILSTAGRGAQPFEYTLRALGGNLIGESQGHVIQFSVDDLIAGLYYWAAGQGTVMRFDFGHPELPAEPYLTVAQTTGITCVGCHALSRDGTKIAVGVDIPGPATLEVYEVQMKARQWTTSSGTPGFPSPNGANFFTFSPDNMRIASSSGTNLVVRSAVDGSGMTTMVQNATMPDWSPDGSRIAFARSSSPAPVGSPGISGGSIATVNAESFVNPQVVVQSQGENNYYPSYSPDGNWIVFNRAAGDSFDAADARIYLVNAAGGAAIPQTIASPSGGDSWPKWGPQVHSYAGGQLLWLTFASRRPYGLRGGTNAQIWMVGIDPARAASGGDASFPAFWLPFQDFASGNHIAQWAEQIIRPPCETECPEGEFCMDGECFPNPL